MIASNGNTTITWRTPALYLTGMVTRKTASAANAGAMARHRREASNFISDVTPTAARIRNGSGDFTATPSRKKNHQPPSLMCPRRYAAGFALFSTQASATPLIKAGAGISGSLATRQRRWEVAERRDGRRQVHPFPHMLHGKAVGGPNGGDGESGRDRDLARDLPGRGILADDGAGAGPLAENDRNRRSGEENYCRRFRRQRQPRRKTQPESGTVRRLVEPADESKKQRELGGTRHDVGVGNARKRQYVGQGREQRGGHYAGKVAILAARP